MAIALSMISVILALPGSVVAGSTHDPILINGDKAFTAANGVVGGSGTAADPYVIEGWDLAISSSFGIHIIGTSSHLVIRNVVVHGSSPTPNGPIGLFLEHVSNVQIETVEVSMCWIGIIAYKGGNVSIEGCSAHDNVMGIRLSYCKDVAIDANSVYSNWWDGITVGASERCAVRGNLMTSNSAGLALQMSRGITVSGNVFTHDGITISGTKLSEFDSHVITSDNLVGGLPVYYYTDVSGMRLEGLQAGEIILAGCENFELDGLTVTGSSTGIEVAFSEVIYFDSCIFQNNHWGLLIVESYWINIQSCTFTGNDIGASISDTEFIIVYECDFSGNPWNGLTLGNSINILVGSCTFTLNDWALSLSECSYATMSGNLITANSLGLYLGYCSKTWVYGNEISHSTWLGIQIWGGKKLLIEQNNFMTNGVQVTVYEPGDISWDNGWSLGNHWDDYTGVDANGDLIGDTPYMIDANNLDNFPLMVPY